MAFLRSVSASDLGPVIQGERVFLRMPQMTDYAEWAELRNQSRAFLTPWEPTWIRDELTRASYRRRVRHYQRDYRDDLGYAFFIFDKSDNGLRGGMTLSNVRRGVTQSCSLGYWVGLPYAQQGYMTAGVLTVLPFVFETLGLHRLEAACLPRNEASIGLLEKIGFEREGVARKYLRINGVWQDHLLFALLKGDV